MPKTLVLKTCLDEGIPGPEHFEIRESPWPNIGDGVIVRLLTVSADPYMRYRIRSDGDYKPGEPMLGLVAGKILESNLSDWKAGDLFGSELPFTEIQSVPAWKAKTFRRLTGLISEDQISFGVGVLGMPGSTAYGGLVDILQPKEGETIWVSGAAGAVGSTVGMMAKQVFNCIVIGSAGGPEKCQIVKEQFGFDHCIDYKMCRSTKDLVKSLRHVAPAGIDMYFENVGGMHFEAAMQCLRPKGRVAICGVISDYNKSKMSPNKIYVSNMIYTEQTVQGFHCLPWLQGERGQFLEDMALWLSEGKVQVRETVFDGLDSFGSAFRALFEGGNIGKVVINLSPKSKL
ncbi:NADPH-dependent oxidoreductase 2-alkenal reductase (AtAER) (NADP-dependent alkenal double bond reductase P1) (DBR1) (NADPH-azodicarbonyl/quinone reductase) (NADPH:2-alkenal/one alpha [Durusdinium trenchii]|uniref:NADPH-dependent oxidoreductase 2-alkenal reductase (AtAER) (NADP-dependent alkenal double bond reductase P1) (DBR1) (NADPH-azodicarbonyl/quinone reductase) (NADPH:2-alkenal/one alpha) n=1 Tax=Durusdinium trenchii TaxID=1381693 RepID=A0ABP0PQ57_9DINO